VTASPRRPVFRATPPKARCLLGRITSGRVVGATLGTVVLLCIAGCGVGETGMKGDSAAQPAVSAAVAGHPVDATIRYRIVVTISDGATVYRESAVQEIGIYENPLPVPLVPAKTQTFVRGEALIMRLGTSSGLIVPIEHGGADFPYRSLLHISCGTSWAGKSVTEYASEIRSMETPCVVPEKALPMFVHVPDLGSDAGLRVIAPTDFSTVVGPNVSLVSVTVEPTDDDLTQHLDRIPWASNLLAGQSLEVTVSANPRPMRLRRGDFLKERF
jgi:hypothetical protein